MRLIVAIEARDKPGLLRRATNNLVGFKANILSSLGYVEDGRAHILFLIEAQVEPEVIEEALEGALEDVEAEVVASKVGPEAVEVVAEFLSKRPALISLLEPYMDPVDLLDVLLRMPEEPRLRVYSYLSPETLAGILDNADDETLLEIARALSPQTLAEALRELDPDEAVDVLQRLPESIVRQVLSMLPPGYREQASTLMRYPPETAGGIMTTSVPVARSDETVQDAIRKLRVGEYDVRDLVVVVDHESKFVGFIEVDELLRHPPGEKLGRIARKPRATVTPELDQEEVARIMLRYYLKRVPVVDTEGRFLGVVSIEDVAYVLAEEAAEDIAKMGGLMVKVKGAAERYITVRVRDLIRARLPWLLLIYVIQSVTANILKSYEDVIRNVAIIAAFIPLIMDTGGNVGSQASSMLIRALALGEISEHSRHDILVVILKELVTATTIGIVFAGIGFAFAYIVSSGSLSVAAAVAATLFIVILFADVVGALLPIIARKLGADPASISAPLITTIVDISVAFIYMAVATTLILGVRP